MALTITPTDSACGAAVTGIDISIDLSGDVVDELRAQWLKHKVLVFPNQELTDNQLERFSQYFGEPGEDGSRSQGIKALGSAAAKSARPSLLAVAQRLVDQLGCQALVAACTEIPLALPEDEVLGVPLVDPMKVLAQEAIARAYGLPDASA